jgi:hypothetical protein
MDAIPLRLENQAYPLNEGPEPLGLDVAIEILSLIGRCEAIEPDGSSSQ